MGGMLGLASAGAGLAGSLMGSSSASSAASNTTSAQLQASNAALQFQYNAYNQDRRDQAPWRIAGQAAIKDAEAKAKAGPGDYKQSPGYLVQLAQGTGAMNAQAAANGMLLSGQQQKSLNQFGQDYATNDYDKYLNRYYQSFNPDLAVAGMGQVSATNTGNAAMQFGNNAAQQAIYSGNARASGYLMQNAVNQNGIGNLYNIANGSSGGYSSPISDWNNSYLGGQFSGTNAIFNSTDYSAGGGSSYPIAAGGMS